MSEEMDSVDDAVIAPLYEIAVSRSVVVASIFAVYQAF